MTEKPKSPPDPELSAIRRILAILDGISEPGKQRVMSYVNCRVYQFKEQVPGMLTKRDGVSP